MSFWTGRDAEKVWESFSKVVSDSGALARSELRDPAWRDAFDLFCCVVHLRGLAESDGLGLKKNALDLGERLGIDPVKLKTMSILASIVDVESAGVVAGRSRFLWDVADDGAVVAIVMAM